MRLKKAQKDKVIEWVAAGYLTNEINDRAAEFDPPFEVSNQQVDWYRKSRRVDIDDIRRKSEFEALNTGLATKQERVKKLKQLAQRLEVDLFGDSPEKDKIWTLEVKGVGSGPIAEIVEYYEFNRSEIDAYRGILDDIAREVGHRVQKQEHSGAIETIQMTKEQWLEKQKQRREEIDKTLTDFEETDE